MAIHEDNINREEILAMDGVRMISDIISHILSMNGTQGGPGLSQEEKLRLESLHYI